jgi:hypothetical protein
MMATTTKSSIKEKAEKVFSIRFSVSRAERLLRKPASLNTEHFFFTD